MNSQDLIKSMTADIYQNMRTAIELGKWGDGRKMTSEQREICVEAVIQYEHLHNTPETERIGYVDMSNKKNKHKHTHDEQDDGIQPIKFV
jgi:uncharacterized protein